MGGADRTAETPVAARDTEARLLSPLRARRFDLLLHLIANLDQPLAVCGRQGSGKTTFLHLLSEQALENWRVVSLDTSTRLTARQAQDAILAALDAGGPGARRDLDALLAELARGGQLAVVVLDDAGRLPPLTLAELHRLARRFPVLRLVLALSPEEARARASTNAGLFDDCHFIEVPPLDENSCGGFLRQLAMTPPRLLAQGDITPELTARIFCDSGGIPGRVLQRLLAPPAKKRAPLASWSKFVWLGVPGMSFAAALLVTAWVWRGREIQQEAPASGEIAPPPAPETSPSAPAEPAASAPEAPVPPAPPPVAETVPDGKPAEAAPPSSGAAPPPVAATAGEAQPAPPAASVSPGPPQAATEGAEDKPARLPVEQTVESASNPQAKERKRESRTHLPAAADAQAKPRQGQSGVKTGLPAGVFGPDWLLAQDSAAWSLQIMSARDPASIAALQKRYPGLKGLAAYRVTRKARALYPVFYGLFSSGEEARRAAARLPASLGTPVPRRLGDIQRDAGASLGPK